MHELINNQRKISFKTQQFQRFIEIVFESVEESNSKSASIVFVSDRKMRGLNKQFRGKNTTTDVLSFPFEPDEFDLDQNHLGDIVISLEQAEKQAAENDLPLEIEIKQLILHGVLHLCGYDHETDEGEMNRREMFLRERLGIG